MKKILTVVVLTLCSLMLSSCASTPLEGLKKVTVGMSKTDILDRVGDPDKTLRHNGQDHWIYKYYQNKAMSEGVIMFENGKVISVEFENNDNAALPKSYDDYKQSVKKKRRSYQKQFETIDD